MDKKEYKKQRFEDYMKRNYPNEYDLIDIGSIWDSELSWKENKRIIEDRIDILSRKEVKKKELDNDREMEGEHHKNINKKIEEKAEKEFEMSLKSISKGSSGVLEEIYLMPKEMTKMVANGNSKGLILHGGEGCGKTYSVIQGFKEVGAEFKLLRGHTTPLEFYSFLQKNKNENILIDDIDILDNKIIVNMLKAGLDDNTRLVQYHSSSPRLRVPNKFIFNGTITIILNKIPDNPDFRAVKSRVLHYKLDLDYKTKIKAITELAKKDYEGVGKKTRMKIARWIKKNTDEATTNLNLRLLFQLFEMYKHDKSKWKKMGEKIIETDEKLKFIIETEKEYKTEKAIKKFEEAGYGSRASYFRYKRKIKNH